MKKMRKFIAVFCVLTILLTQLAFASGSDTTANETSKSVSQTSDLKLTAKSAILMEQTTGKVLYENNADEKLPPASVTKVMTLLLVMEAIDSKKISLSDKVACSENAASMGGSQVYLEPGEEMTVSELLKAVCVASGNDASVMLAEFVGGSEEAFIDMMNEKAKQLKMANTHFVNCTGLDADGHYTSARDIAIMSKELLKHKGILDYTSIWMDSLRNGKFALVNTNRLIRFYDGATGLKTGSTSKALFCLSASALKNNMPLIAVVMSAPTSKERFADATKLLDYGYAKYSLATPAKNLVIPPVKVLSGDLKTVDGYLGSSSNVVVSKGSEKDVVAKLSLAENLMAPVKQGQKIGTVKYYYKDQLLSEHPILAVQSVGKMGLIGYIRYILGSIFH